MVPLLGRAPRDQKSQCMWLYLVVTGLEGSGKSVLCEFLRDYVLGPPITAFFEGVEDMTEKHNCKEAGKRLWVLEECRSTREEFIHTMDSLKRLITNPVRPLLQRGMAIREVTNIGMMIILSNPVDCINVTTTDRRYSFIPTSPDRRGIEHRGHTIPSDAAGDRRSCLHVSLQGLPDPTVPLKNAMRRRIQSCPSLDTACLSKTVCESFRMCIGGSARSSCVQWCQQHGHAKSLLNAARFHGKMEELSHGPMPDLEMEEQQAAQQKLSIIPRRKDNKRGYGPRETGAAAMVVEQPHMLAHNIDYGELRTISIMVRKHEIEN